MRMLQKSSTLVAIVLPYQYTQGKVSCKYVCQLVLFVPQSVYVMAIQATVWIRIPWDSTVVCWSSRRQFGCLVTYRKVGCQNAPQLVDDNQLGRIDPFSPLCYPLLLSPGEQTQGLKNWGKYKAILLSLLRIG